MNLVNRKRELSALKDVISDNGDLAMVVEGPEGFGKTALLNAVARLDSTETVFVRGSATEAMWAYSGVLALLSAIDALRGSSLQRQVGALTADMEAFEVAQWLDALFRDTSLAPFAVLIDDGDLLDERSQQVLGYTFRRMSLSGMRSVIAVTACPPESPYFGIPRIVLDPLSEATLVEFGLSMTPPTIDHAVLEACARSCEGSPGAYLSILEALPADVIHDAASLPTPMRPGLWLTAKTGDRLTGLGDLELTVLRILSSAPYLPEGVFSEIFPDYAQALDHLVAENFVVKRRDKLLIENRGVSGGVYWSMRAAERVAIHDQLARECSAGCPPLHAWHASFQASETGHAAVLLSEATRLVEVGALGPGVEFAERAVGIRLSDEVHDELAALIKALLTKAEFNLAQRYSRLAQARLGTAVLSPVLALQHVVIDYVLYQKATECDIWPVVDRFGQEKPDECIRLLCAGALCHLERWDIDKARGLLGRAKTLEGHKAPIVAVGALTALYSSVIEGVHPPEMSEFRSVATAMKPIFGDEVANILVGRCLSLAEKYDEARNLLNTILDRNPFVAKIWVAFARHVAFANECRAGRFQRARELSRLLFNDGAHKRFLPIDEALSAALIAILDGDLDAAHAQIRLARQCVGVTFSPNSEARIACVQALIALAVHGFDEAAMCFERARHLGRAWSNPQLLRISDDFIEALVLAGRREEARAVHHGLLEAADRSPSAWTRRAAERCVPLLLEGEESLQAFHSLLTGWTDVDHEYLRSRTLYSYAGRLKQLGNEQDGEEALHLAQRIVYELGASPEAALCGGNTDSAQPATLEEILTDKELDVVRLVVKGHKNQAIAHELYVSVRTVELRLTTIYRKVGVKSRFELMRQVSDSTTDQASES